jgi:hypothetical protein
VFLANKAIGRQSQRFVLSFMGSPYPLFIEGIGYPINRKNRDTMFVIKIVRRTHRSISGSEPETWIIIQLVLIWQMDTFGKQMMTIPAYILPHGGVRATQIRFEPDRWV